MNINKTDLRIVGNLLYGNYPTKIILHHPEFNGDVEALNEMMISMGYQMIGYNYYVRKDGSIWGGRPVSAIGANCHGQNATSIGIAFEGNFMTDIMGDAQFSAGVELCKYLMQQYPSIHEIGPHKKYFATACPGDNFPVDKMISEALGGYVVPANNGANILKLWDSGEAVKVIQQKLIKLGYEIYGGADGIFGQATYNAVELFQASKKLTADGIVGPQTMVMLDMAIANKDVIDIHAVKYLQHAIGATEDNIPGPATLSKCPILKMGCNSNITKWLQAHLGITADGIFGNGTKIAVQNFQVKYGLVADGIVGQNTWKKLLGL